MANSIYWHKNASATLPTCAFPSLRSSFVVYREYGGSASVVITHCAVEPMLPELTEPWVAGVRVGIEAEVIVIEIRNVGRVDADGHAAPCLAFIPVSDVTTVCPAITVK